MLTDQSTEARLGQDIWRAVRRSNARLATAAVITLSLLHVYLVAGYDVKTTLVMLRLVDRTQVLLATLIVALPAFLPLMLNAQVPRRILRGLRFGNVDWKDQALSAAAATFGALALVNVLTPLVWAVVAVSSVAAYLRNRRLRKVGRMGPGRHVHHSCGTVGQHPVPLPAGHSSFALLLSIPTLGAPRAARACGRERQCHGICLGRGRRTVGDPGR